MSLSIHQNFVTDLENFAWGKDWRAMRIIKEKRTDGEYYFAHLIRYYGEIQGTNDYDVGESLAETAWLGRNEKFVGKRMFDKDEDSPTFGKRVYSSPVTETIEETNEKGKTVSREVLVDGKTIYEYTIRVNKDNTEKMKTLAGAVALNQETQFLFVYGAGVPPHAVDPDTFWNTSVSDYLQKIETIKTEKNGKKV